MSGLIDRNVLKANMYQEAFESDTDMQKWDSGCWIRYKLFEKVVDSTPTVPYGPRWHRAEEEPRDGQECIVAYLGPTQWFYEHATYHSDLNKVLEEDIFIEGTDGFVVDGDVGYARHGLFKYWMPIEPPQEDK